MNNGVRNALRKTGRQFSRNDETQKVAFKKLGHESGIFLVAQLASELEPEAGVKVPTFPISAKAVVCNMEGTMEPVADPEWSGRYVRYQIAHPGIIFNGIVDAKKTALAEANSIVSTGCYEQAGGAFAAALARVRAAQVLVDWFHFKEGKRGPEYHLGSGYVAQWLTTHLCLQQAEKDGKALAHLRVPDNAPLPFDQLFEGMGTNVLVSAFESALSYAYTVPQAGAIHKVVLDLTKIAEDVEKGMQYVPTEGIDEDDPAEKTKRYWYDRFREMTPSELRLLAYAAGDILAELHEMSEMQQNSANGNGKAATLPGTSDNGNGAPAGTQQGTDDVDPEQQAEYERVAAEENALRNGGGAPQQDTAPVADSAPEPEAPEPQAEAQPTPEQLRLGEQMRISREAKAKAAVPPPVPKKTRKPRKASEAASVRTADRETSVA